MKRIGLISDTHGALSERVVRFFEQVDEIWHAGDIGTEEVIRKLLKIKPVRAVCGNIDGHVLRQMYPEVLRFFCEEVDVLMTHIGGYPGRYEPKIRQMIYSNPPQLFISGHSHILKIIHDKKIGCLHMNPGAAGNNGFHHVCTAVRFKIDGKNIKELEVLEFERSKFNNID